MTPTVQASLPALALLIRTPGGRRIAVTRQGAGFAAVADEFEGIVTGAELSAVIAAAALDMPEAPWIAAVAARVEREMAEHEAAR